MPGPRTVLRLMLLTLLIGGVMAQAPPASAATLVVTTTADDVTNDGNCSLREAIIAANGNATQDQCVHPGGTALDTIQVPPGTYTLVVAGFENSALQGDLDILGAGGDLVIESQGGTPQNTIIQAGTVGANGPGTPNGIDRVFHIATGGSAVTFRDLTIRNGIDASGDGGGAINFDGDTLTLQRVAVRDSSTGAGEGGGGIWASGTLNLDRVEISGNHALGESSGGGVRVLGGSVLGDGVTVSGNSAENDAGGMWFSEPGFSALAGVTIANNVADSDEDDGGDAGGILQCCDAQVFFTGSVLADNVGQSQFDCTGDFNPGSSFGANIVENAATCTGFDAGDTGIDPQLQPLALNAPGTTRTHAIPSASPAVDRWPLDGGGDGDGCTTDVGKFGVQTSDQRGAPRPSGGACDSGAYEFQLPIPGVCKGKTATLTGTAEGEALVGTNGNDVIAALGGNDTVKAGRGKDLVCGGDGNDKLNGSGGNDKLLGEAGNDKLKGGGGNDKMIGAKGNDKCSGAGGTRDKARKCEKTGGLP